MKEFLYYARIFVEICIDDEMSDEILFENEWGRIKYYKV